MVQLERKALTTNATENRLILRRHQSRSTSFAEGSAFSLSCGAEEKILPVFTFPQALDFYFNDANSLEQEVSVLNPYLWPIKFRVLTTTPGRYYVDKFEGDIAATCKFDFKVRLLDRSPSLIGKQDKLRIEMQTITECIKLGKKDLDCNFYKEYQEEEQKQCTNPDSLNDDRLAFEKILSKKSPPTDKKPQEIAAATAKSATSKSDTQGANRNKSKNDPKSSWPPSSYVFTAIMCGIILCLPTEECILPSYLVISHTPKYIAAYVLGIITSLLCKYN
ncbi:motile sperm domain-containing protein 1 [Tetranychus urticae]|uniref:Motile sperm domain-containing protein 1 n=1 Tax=Tetranychus urticae TaxID=32264 RepID=T1K3B8_TETUR|nr:motile sperm domain-containing protein 1 [Tetranychus urticae]